MCAMFKEVRFNSAKNSISASDSLLAENPIKAWAIHTPTLSRCGRLWTPASSSNDVRSSDVALSLLPKSKTTSLVWEHFGFEADNSGQKPNTTETAVCRLCRRNVEAKGGNTSNLRSHLRVHHQLTFRELERMRQEKGGSSH